MSVIKTLVSNSSFTDSSGEFITLSLPASVLAGRDHNRILKIDIVNKSNLETLLSLASNGFKFEYSKDQFSSLNRIHLVVGDGDGTNVNQLYFDLLEPSKEWSECVADNLEIRIHLDVDEKSNDSLDSMSKFESEISFTNQLLISNGHTLKDILSYTWYQYMAFVKALSYQIASKEANDNLNLFSAVAHAGACIMGSSKSAKSFEKQVLDKLKQQQKQILEI